MEATERFAELVTLPDPELPLDETALLIAAHADPSLDVAGYLGRLDDLAATCPGPTLDRMVAHLFASGRFSGNAHDYYDPRNSFLSDVLDRGVGIPITLAVIALEVGRRVGVPLSGVGMPGHFLLRDKVDPAVFVDPFHDGQFLAEADCRRLHRSLAGPAAGWDPQWLDPIDRRAVVVRLLANLTGIFQARGDASSLRWVLFLRSLVPGLEGERAELARLMAPYN